ncbi:MAG: PEP-CTERM sorting domain-containing protein [Tepidisphaeraceae bacterium]
MRGPLFPQLASGLLLSGGVAVASPIALSPGTASYVQNFDTLSSDTSGSQPFANDSTIPGLWAGQGNATPFPAITSYTPTSTGNAISLLSLGSNADADRALGSRNANATGPIRYGFVVQNTSQIDIDSITVTYTGEQWRQDFQSGASSTDELDFSYRTFVTPPTTDDSSVLSGSVINVPALNFVSPQPQINGTSATALDGNAAANRQTLSATLTGVDLQPNEYLVIRWNDANISGNDNALGVDDLSVSAAFVPEPASLLGVAALAGLALRRRGRSASDSHCS